MVTSDNFKGNKKGRPFWAFIKNASLAITIFLFFLTMVLVLDAYKFVSIRHAKFARKKLLHTLQYMDPSIVETHTGLKVLTKDEFSNHTINLEKARNDVFTMNTKLEEKKTAVSKISTELQNMKKNIEETKTLIAAAEASKAAAEAEAAKAAAAAEVAKAAVDAAAAKAAADAAAAKASADAEAAKVAAAAAAAEATKAAETATAAAAAVPAAPAAGA